MPLYFFDTSGPGGKCSDEEGIALPDFATAQRCARRALCEIARDYLKGGHATFVVLVRDTTGKEVYRAFIALTESHPSGPTFICDPKQHATPDINAAEQHL